MTSRYFSHIFLISLIFLVIGLSLWSPGGIVLLDFVITPHNFTSLWKAIGFPLFDFLARIIGYEVVSKGFFIMVLWFAGYLGIRIGSYVAGTHPYRGIIESIGAIFFVMNPYSYERMMVQPTIYMGSILLGYMIYHLLFSDGKLRYIGAGAYGGLSFIMMPHASYMIALILGLYIILYVRTLRDMGHILGIGLIILLLNLNWIIAPLFGVANSAGTISTFSMPNLEAFRTQALAPLDVWGTNLLLYGFWGERYASHYVRVDILSSLWYISGFFLLVLMIYGYYRFYQSGRRRETWMLGILGGLSLIFGIGIASPLTEGLTRWMIEYIPLWQGYREPQKWIGLLMIVEGIGFILGAAYLLERFQKDRIVRLSIITTILLLLIIWSPGPLLGYHGQLRTTVYPSEFESVRAELLSQSGVKVLTLPWHAYIGCAWMGRPIISNPIKGLLGGVEVISSDNIEVANILYSNSTSSESSIIESFIGSGSHDISPLRERGFSHILLMKQCANSHRYEWLDMIASCKKLSESDVHTLYHCH